MKEGAEKCFDKVVELTPYDISAFIKIANAYGEMGNQSKQIECMKRAAELGDEDCVKWLKDKGIK